eukprot:scaffold13002_cov125-Isochrysis_galbana.AAC.1
MACAGGFTNGHELDNGAAAAPGAYEPAADGDTETDSTLDIGSMCQLQGGFYVWELKCGRFDFSFCFGGGAFV